MLNDKPEMAAGRKNAADYRTLLNVMDDAKPAVGNSLMPILRRAHYDCGAIPNPQWAVNARDGNAEFAGLAAAFARQAADAAAQVRRALAGRNATELRRACHEIKTGATASGYITLGAAAETAHGAAARSISAARGPALRLMAACRLLHESTRSAPPRAA